MIMLPNMYMYIYIYIYIYIWCVCLAFSLWISLSIYMGQVTKLRLSCYPVLLSIAVWENVCFPSTIFSGCVWFPRCSYCQYFSQSWTYLCIFVLSSRKLFFCTAYMRQNQDMDKWLHHKRYWIKLRDMPPKSQLIHFANVCVCVYIYIYMVCVSCSMNISLCIYMYLCLNNNKVACYWFFHKKSCFLYDWYLISGESLTKHDWGGLDQKTMGKSLSTHTHL